MADIFSIASSALPPSAQVVGFRGTEAISRPYAFHIGLYLPLGEEIDMKAAIGTRATLTIDRGPAKPPVYFSGVIGTLELLHELPGKSLFQLTLVPKLWHLTLASHSRIFTDNTIPDILKAVLKDGGLAEGEFVFKLSGSYKTLEHVCQYKETSFAFISRLMEREGIYYFFEHTEDKETMVLTDHKSFHQLLTPETATFHPVPEKDVSASDAMNSFRCRVSSLPKKVRFTDYDYIKPSLELSAGVPVSNNGFGEIVSYGENFQTPDEGKRLAQVRAEALLTSEMMFRGHGRLFHLRSGYLFPLDDHPRPTFNAQYLVVEIKHHGNQSAASAEVKAWLDLAYDDEYRVDVVAIPKDVQFRAERKTPWPRVDGVVDGVVDGPASSPYAQIDGHGRYKVRIFFDESDLIDGSASTWVRMLQPHGGSTEGFHFPLRKDTEVHVAFLGGDPDRPVIAGVAHNTHKPSAVTAANHTLNVIQTGGANRIEMEDKAGGQYIHLFSPPFSSSLHLGAGVYNYAVHTDGQGSLDIAGNYDVQIGGHMTEDVTGSVTETYLSTQDTTVDGAVTETYKSTLDQTVTGAVTNTYEATLDEEVTGAVTQTYSATHDLTVTGAVTETFEATLDQTVTGAVTNTYKSTLTETVTGAVNQTYNATQNLTVGGAVTEKFGGTWTLDVTGAVTGTMPKATWNCPDWSVNSGKFWEVRGASGTIAAASISVTGASVSATGISASVTGASLSATGFSFDAKGPFISFEGPNLRQRGPKIDTIVILVSVASVHLFV